jgi:hypothetical protein
MTTQLTGIALIHKYFDLKAENCSDSEIAHKSGYYITNKNGTCSTRLKEFSKAFAEAKDKFTEIYASREAIEFAKNVLIRKNGFSVDGKIKIIKKERSLTIVFVNKKGGAMFVAGITKSVKGQLFYKNIGLVTKDNISALDND